MKQSLIILFFLCRLFCYSQTKPGTSFSGANSKDPGVCAASAGNFMSEQQVENLITEMLGKIGTKNRYIIVNCTQVENCQAFLYKGRPYILYNPNFLGRVKRLNFSEATLPSVSDKDWETLTILAHELGHHVNNHLLNPLPDATQQDMELEADETAGFIVYLLGGTLSQAQLAYINIQEKSSYTHPGRQKRMNAIAKGWNDAKEKYPKSTVITEPGTIKDVDENIYKTVKIGSQVWMQSNLNTSRFRNGEAIPQAKSKEEWDNAYAKGLPMWCYYNYDPANGKTYGKMYNWFVVSDPRGLAPYGYHVPSIDEWKKLIEFLGGGDVAGVKLKSSGNWLNAGGGDNSSGFSGLPGGYVYPMGVGNVMGKYGYWWSSTEHDAKFAKNVELNYDNNKMEIDYYFKAAGYSVRCIKD